MIRAALLAAIALVASTASAETPVARVILMYGSSEPPIDVTREFAPGARIQLQPGSNTVVIHYVECEEMVTEFGEKGGEIVIGARQIRFRGGKIRDRIKGDCPGEIALVDTDAKGAVTLMRGARKEIGTSISGPRPRFVIATSEPKAFLTLSVFRNETEIANLPFVAGRAEWPADAPALAPGGSYPFALERLDGGHIGGVLTVAADGPGLIVLEP